MKMEKKNNTLLILVIILSILVISLGGFIVIDKMTNDNFQEEKNDKNENNNYEQFSNNLKKEISKYNEYAKNSQFVISKIIPDGYEVYLNNQQELFVKYYNSELNEKYGEYKISDNVLGFYIIPSGQDVGNSLYFINDDGTVGMSDVEYGIEMGQISVRKDLGYKNIVSITSGSFSGEMSGIKKPIFIDINGNINY